MARINPRTLRGLLVPVAVLVLWQLLSSKGILNAHVLPSPAAVLSKWWAYCKPLEAFDPAQMSKLRWLLSGELPQDAYASLYRVVAGFLIGAGLALPLGLVYTPCPSFPPRAPASRASPRGPRSGPRWCWAWASCSSKAASCWPTAGARRYRARASP